VRAASEALLAWYERARRDLPWRRTRDPYAIWVSEVMLQQTQVATVVSYFERWMQRFPTVRALAEADEQHVLEIWQGLGYYSRARRLLRGARAVVDRHDGAVPNSRQALLQLPGIGPYSAGAIASIAHGERAPIVDGNVVRVLCRFHALRGDPTRAPLKQLVWQLADEHVPPQRPGDFNQALMELGATVCTPKQARCHGCPLSATCAARDQGLVASLPELPKRPAPTKVNMVAGLLQKSGKTLLRKLPSDAPRWAGLWEFPSAEVQSAEGAQQAVRRALSAAGIDADVGERFATIRHGVTRYRITLDAYRCSVRGRSTPARSDVRWATAEEVTVLPLPAAHRKIATLLLRAQGARGSSP
jgi:A/G-specific adenine glycosylase